MDNTIKKTKNNKKHDGKFRKKKIKHNSQEESSRVIFGDLKDEKLD
ncbi:CPC_1213 family protein [Clostridium rectalis]|nr:CPC_1213 family protein [Clostridium rectalis]